MQIIGIKTDKEIIILLNTRLGSINKCKNIINIKFNSDKSHSCRKNKTDEFADKYHFDLTDFHISREEVYAR